MTDDYLWDGSGPPDEEVRRLETMLAPHRWRGVVPPRPRPVPVPWYRIAAAAALLAAGLSIAAASTTSRVPATVVGERWPVKFLDGTPVLRGSKDALTAGGSLRTDALSRAEVHIPDVGRLQLAPGSALRMVRGDSGERRVALDRGSLRAVTTAVPRTLFVETPSATAVDLGCIFDVEVLAGGESIVRVDVGQVGFQRDGQECLIPAGAECRTWPARGPGVPRFMDAPADLKAALDRLDAGIAGEEDLMRVLRHATTRDTLSLWHLVPRHSGEWRERIVNAARDLVPLPHGVTRAGVLSLQPTMLTAWREAMSEVW